MELTKAQIAAEKTGMSINGNSAHVAKIEAKLEANGGYCPCLPQRNADTICPCKYSRKLNVCRCGLLVP